MNRALRRAAAGVHALSESWDEPAPDIRPGGEAKAGVAAATGIASRWRLSNKEHERAIWLAMHHGHLSGAAQQPWSRIQPILLHPGAPS